MTALLVGSGLAVLALILVLVPLLRGRVYLPPPEPERSSRPSAVEALREIEFDHETGKLSAEDYASLRATCSPRAVAELRARDGVETVPSRGMQGAGAEAGAGAASAGADDAVDAAERLIERMKARSTVCPDCGPRPEADALFCSDCGRYLARACLRCGAAVRSPTARFCGECGGTLAA